MSRALALFKKSYKVGLVLSLAIFMLFIFYEIHNVESNGKRYLSDHYLSTGVQETGSINIVTSVLYDYRAFDTLGETTVLLTAATILAFMVPIRKAAMPSASFTIFVDKTVKWMIPYLAVLGAYLIFFGHLSPGGGFVGGVVLATIPILLTITFGVEVSEYAINPAYKKLIEDIGVIGFIFLGLLGMWTGSHFLANGQAYFGLGNPGELVSAGIIPFLNVLIGIKVGAGLVIIFNSLVKEK
ncbi:hydrogen gas-evolving membrane-bound hydrogenase subunit E [Bacillus weihaiensis]|uniref:hydrogen gas-evolving membrane-bound hydrogenase subunit E n=1 Tax=Bacillus weihaiensis TaxID=1547283 RepID=UPI002356926A|nr:hydrogen gas-evolving membrane-bound hydrogenase subunit E [Bacillus weihaiensis]